MNHLKLLCSFSLLFISYCATGLIQSSATYKKPAHCDISVPHLSTTLPGLIKIIFATSKYDNSPQGAIVGFTRFNGKPLTCSSTHYY